jgi:fatty acyl-CoA reductase
MLRLSVFDLDGTILRGWSAETRLVYFLVRKRLITLRQCVHYGVAALERLGGGFVEAFYSNKYYLRDVRVSELEASLPEFCAKLLAPNFAPQVLDRMRKLKEQQYRTVILSGTLQPILIQLQRILQVDEVLGSELEVHDGVFTGRQACARPYGAGKVAILARHFAGEGIDYPASFAFANALSDVPLLREFGNPVAVNPGRRLRRFAREKGWEILD